jgi:hypothetical protein
MSESDEKQNEQLSTPTLTTASNIQDVAEGLNTFIAQADMGLLRELSTFTEKANEIRDLLNDAPTFSTPWLVKVCLAREDGIATMEALLGYMDRGVRCVETTTTQNGEKSRERAIKDGEYVIENVFPSDSISMWGSVKAITKVIATATEASKIERERERHRAKYVTQPLSTNESTSASPSPAQYSHSSTLKKLGITNVFQTAEVRKYKGTQNGFRKWYKYDFTEAVKYLKEWNVLDEHLRVYTFRSMLSSQTQRNCDRFVSQIRNENGDTVVTLDAVVAAFEALYDTHVKQHVVTQYSTMQMKLNETCTMFVQRFEQIERELENEKLGISTKSTFGNLMLFIRLPKEVQEKFRGRSEYQRGEFEREDLLTFLHSEKNKALSNSDMNLLSYINPNVSTSSARTNGRRREQQASGDRRGNKHVKSTPCMFCTHSNPAAARTHTFYKCIYNPLSPSVARERQAKLYVKNFSRYNVAYTQATGARPVERVNMKTHNVHTHTRTKTHPKNPKSNQGSSEVQCYSCQEYGHISPNCPHKKQ